MSFRQRQKQARPRTMMILLSVLVSAAVLAGCSSEPTASGLTDPNAAWQGGATEASAAPNSSQSGVKNIAGWALPLDEFVPEFSNLDNYAEQLLLASCLSQKNIAWPVPWQDIDEPTSPVFNPTGRRLFNLEIAKKYGFRTNLAPSKSAQLWETFLTYQPTEPGFQDAFDTCLDGIRAEHPLVSSEDTMFVNALIAQIQEQAFQDSAVQEAAGRWRSCMEPQGLGQLPENPNEFPSLELQGELGAVPPVKTVEPSARELDVAVAHATCLDSSGFSAAMYEKQWELQETAIERERTKLDAIRDAVQARQAAVKEIIAANAPKA